MNRSLALVLLALPLFNPAGATAEVIFGPGVLPIIDGYTIDDYRIVAGTQITAPSLSGPPAINMIAKEAVNLFGGGSVRFDGGEFHGGNVTFNGPPATFTSLDAGSAVRVSNFTANIYAGTFLGGNSYSTSDNGNARGGAGFVATSSTVNFFGGTFQGGTLTQPNFPPPASNYPAVADVVLRASTGHLHGGDIGYIVLANDAILHVYGTDFQLTFSTLYGKFADGSPINLTYYNGGQVILHDLQVPEPRAILLPFLATTFAFWRPCSRSSRVC